MTSDKENQLVKNTLIISVGVIASKAVSFIMAPLFSRWLSVEEYGAYDLMITYASLIAPFCTLSISEAVFRFLMDGNYAEKKKNIVSNGLTVVLTGYLSFLILYFTLSKGFNLLEFNFYLLLYLFGELLFSYFCEVVRGQKQLGLYSITNFISTLLVLIVSAFLILICNIGMYGIVLGQIIACLVCTGILLFFSKCYNLISKRNVDKAITVDMIRYSWPLIPNSISWWIVNVSDRIIINKWVGLAANGIYAVSNKIPSVVSILFSVFHISWLQSASENVEDKDYAVFCNSIFNRLFIFTCSTISVLICGNFLYYSILFDSKYYEAYYYTPILIVAAGVSCIGQFIGGIMIAQKNTKGNGFTNILAAIANVIINLIMISAFGLFAASVSTLIAYSILVLVRYIFISKYVVLRLKKESLLMLTYMLICLLIVYLNILYLNIIGFVISILIFLFANKSIINTIFI